MCGRFAIDQGVDDLVRDFLVGRAQFPTWLPRWNIAPTSTIPIIVERTTGLRELGPARWSLVPPWSPELTLRYPTFNARSETAATKPTFQKALATTRCLIPASGYYEWSTRDGVKKPHYLYPSTRTPWAFAGLYSWWTNPDTQETVATATITTRASVGWLTTIHDRMPVIVPPKRFADWLNPEDTDGARLITEMSEATASLVPEISGHEVAPLKGEGPELIAPVAGCEHDRN